MRIVFCGVGALGSTAAVLCRSLGADLRLVDFDRVETKNLAAQAFVKQSLGKNKAEALKLQLWNFWGVRAEALPVRVVDENVAAACAGADHLPFIGLLAACLARVVQDFVKDGRRRDAIVNLASVTTMSP